MNGLHNAIRGSFPKMSSYCLAPVRAPLRCLFSKLPEPPIRPESWPSRGQPLSLLCPSSCRWLFWSVPLAPDPSFFSLPPAGVLPMASKSHPFLRRKKNATVTSSRLFVVCHPGDQTQAWRTLDKPSTSQIYTQLCRHLPIRARWLKLFRAVVCVNEHYYRKDQLCLQDHIQHK